MKAEHLLLEFISTLTHSTGVNKMHSRVRLSCIDLLRSSDTYMRIVNYTTLVQIMGCRRTGDKPLCEPMVVYCQLYHNEHISMKYYLKCKSFYSGKWKWKCRLPKWRPSCLGLNMLRDTILQCFNVKEQINLLMPSDAIWRWRSWSTLVQVMACCLTVPSHYLNQCWLTISKVLWHSSDDFIIRRFEDTNQ